MTVLSAGAALAVAASGCSSGPGATAGSSAGAPTTSAAAVVSVGIEHDGATVDLAPGQRLEVTLASTYWQLALAPGSGPLALVSNDVVPGGPGCAATIPGSGCGIARLVARAVADGSATVSGSRTSCGEALRCGPGQGSYELRVVVHG